MKIIKEFEDVRNWGKIRGIDGADPQIQFQRFMQEGLEIHKALIENDEDEFQDAIGDTIVTLINLAKTKGYTYVLDANSVVFAVDGKDITEEVLKSIPTTEKAVPAKTEEKK